MNYFGNIGGFELIQDTLSKREDKIRTKTEREGQEGRGHHYEPPSLTAICQLTMMVSMPFQLFHFDFVMGADGEEDEELEEDADAWMFFAPSAYPSNKVQDHARSYWKIDGNKLHESA